MCYKVLVVEDEAIVALDLKKSLEGLGYKIQGVVSSGEEAVAMVKEERPHLILMDIMLKGKMDGIEAASIIRSQYQIPVIYLTAFSGEWVQERAKETDPFGYILKPFDERELHTIIEIALYRDKMEKELREGKEWLFTTLKSIGDGVIATNVKGEIQFINPIAQSLTGWTNEEAQGRPLKEVFNIISEKTGEEVENPVAKVIEKGVVVGLANHTILICKGGQHFFIDDSAAPIKDVKGNLIGVVLVFRDITQKRIAQQEEDKKTQEILKQQAILLDLVKADFRDFEITVARMTKIAAKALGVERVSLWLFNDDYTCITCQVLYISTEDSHEKGHILKAHDLPDYFKALQGERSIAINDIRMDPRTIGFDTYHRETGVISMLDASIWLYGRQVGIVCHEDLAIREWRSHEKQFATSMADIFSLALISSAHSSCKRDLGGEKDYRSFVHNLPVGVYRSTLTDNGRFVLVNKAFLMLLGYDSKEELLGIQVASIFRHKGEWERMKKLLLEKGSIKGYKVKKKGKDGQIIQVSLSCQLMDSNGTAYVDVVNLVEDIW